MTLAGRTGRLGGLTALAVSLLFTSLVALAAEPGSGDLRQAVADTERAFAQTMADRDFEAFKSFLSDEAIFFSGETPLRGKSAVAEQWKAYFDTPEAPFSWAPETVEVLDSGTLALSSGPVLDPAGACVGTFSSIWRLEGDGQWKIVFDKGSRDCSN